MKANVVYFRIALVAILLAIGAHSYLAYHHYEISLGAGSSSICNINAKFDCDAVNVSRYSEFLSLPLALWGAMTNLALGLILITGRFLEPAERDRWQRFALALALWIAFVSIVMGTISTGLLGTYCLFCISTYVLSFLTLFAVWRSTSTPLLHHIREDLRTLFTVRRGLVVMMALIPASVWITDQMAMQSFAGGNISDFVKSSVQSWQNEPVKNLNFAGATLTMGADAATAKVTLVEFADFLCPHCKEAAPKLHAFVRSHPDTRLIFVTFPLDGACNPSIPHSQGVRCRLSKIDYCAIEHGKGWEVHDSIFAHQTDFHSNEDVDRIMGPLIQDLGMDWTQIRTCVEDAKTHQMILDYAKVGYEAGIQGTPTLFLNGRTVMYGQILPVLQAAYRSAIEAQ